MPTAPFAHLRIAEDGTAAIHRHDVDGHAGVAAILTEAVGGLFAAVATDYAELGIWCNEEGELLRLSTNLVATAVAFLLGGPAQVLLGPVVITGQHGEHPVGLTDDQVDTMLALAAMCRR